MTVVLLVSPSKIVSGSETISDGPGIDLFECLCSTVVQPGFNWAYQGVFDRLLLTYYYIIMRIG